MIIKSVKVNCSKTSLRFLTNYLEQSKQNENQTRVADRFFFNQTEEAFDLQTCATDMLQVMNKNERVKSAKYAHYVLSLEEGQTLSHDEWKEYLSKTLKSLGLEEHQAYAVMHCDTDNQHVHLVVNKINPNTLNVAQLAYEKLNLKKLRTDINEELDLRFNQSQSKELSKTKSFNSNQSFTSYVSQLKDQLFKANSWQEFFKVLQDNGVTYSQHGNGYVFQSLDQQFATKASNINRNFSIKKLEQKFGKLEETFVPDIKPVRQYERTKKKKTKPKYIVSFNEQFNTDSLFFIQSKKELESRALQRGDKIHDKGNSITSQGTPSPQTLIEMLVTMQHRVGKNKTLLIKGDPTFERNCYELAKMLKINVVTQNLKLQNVVGHAATIPFKFKQEKLNELYLTEKTKIDKYLRQCERIMQERQSNRVLTSTKPIQSVRHMPTSTVVSREKRQSTMPMSDLPKNDRKPHRRR